MRPRVDMNGLFRRVKFFPIIAYILFVITASFYCMDGIILSLALF